jgi:hypothetical protein
VVSLETSAEGSGGRDGSGGADRLTTFNVRHLDAAAMVFGIRTSLPAAVLREIRGASHEKK